MTDKTPQNVHKQKDPQKMAVFHEPIGYVEGEEWNDVTKTKTIRDYLHSAWETWYEETMVNETKTITLYARHLGPIFSRKIRIALNILNEDDTIFYKAIEVDDLDEVQVVVVELPPDNNLFNAVGCEVLVHPSHFLSPKYNIGNNFEDANRPHNFVLKIGRDCRFYVNKTVLALWSNFFDELFFSNKESKEITEYVNENLSGWAVDRLLDMCLRRKHEFHHTIEHFTVEQVDAAYALQITVARDLINECKYFILSRRDLMKGLELSDRYNLKELRKRCGELFRNFGEGEKKKFFVENEENIKKLSLHTIHHFLTEGQNFKRSGVLHDVLVVPEARETEKMWEISKTGVNSRQDVCLLVGDERFEVHKEYLAFWSPFFDRLFFGDFIEKDMVEMEIKEVDPQEFSTLLRLIYPPGYVRIDDSNVEYLLKLADRFEMKTVMAMCSTYLAKVAEETESHDKLMDIFELSDNHFLVDAQLSCLRKLHDLNQEEPMKFRWNYRRRLALLSENTRNNIIMTI